MLLTSCYDFDTFTNGKIEYVCSSCMHNDAFHVQFYVVQEHQVCIRSQNVMVELSTASQLTKARNLAKCVYIWYIFGYLEPHKVFWIIHVSDLWHSLWDICRNVIYEIYWIHEILMPFSNLKFPFQCGRIKGNPVWEMKKILKILKIELFALPSESF